MSLIKTALKYEPNSRFTLLYGNRDSSSVIFLETLAGLKDKHLGRLEIYHFLDQEEQDIELFNGMLNRERLEEAITALVPDAAEVDGWFICGPGPMMDAAEGVLLDRNIPKDRIHIERFTADRPPEAVSLEIEQLRTQGGRSHGFSYARRPHPASAFHRWKYSRQRARIGAARALRLQSGGMRDLPGKSDQGQGRDGGSLWSHRRRGRRRLRPHLPVGAARRRGRSGLRRIS